MIPFLQFVTTRFEFFCHSGTLRLTKGGWEGFFILSIFFAYEYQGQRLARHHFRSIVGILYNFKTNDKLCLTFLNYYIIFVLHTITYEKQKNLSEFLTNI